MHLLIHIDTEHAQDRGLLPRPLQIRYIRTTPPRHLHVYRALRQMAPSQSTKWALPFANSSAAPAIRAPYEGTAKVNFSTSTPRRTTLPSSTSSLWQPTTTQPRGGSRVWNPRQCCSRVASIGRPLALLLLCCSAGLAEECQLVGRMYGHVHRGPAFGCADAEEKMISTASTSISARRVRN